jgi:hypothetical protein
MNRIFLLATFVLTTVFVGCADDVYDYDCTVTWCDGKCDEGGMEVGTETYSYKAVPEAADAVAMCGDDQETDPAKPDTANAYSCSCESK